ncbi:MAG TPA: hypothetical protein PKY35_14400 [Candidatus Hydrogenedentes bacterium]|nr:hypothetical protein [Candidatus Hydrogenedentota bacterium]HOL78211.1 hypothetical protein [Candidatus Hydrogenedentota bacterium]HPO87226.1 hypothetical protein [Candidatus Hydrogenedentota bacterium]
MLSLSVRTVAVYGSEGLSTLRIGKNPTVAACSARLHKLIEQGHTERTENRRFPTRFNVTVPSSLHPLLLEIWSRDAADSSIFLEQQEEVESSFFAVYCPCFAGQGHLIESPNEENTNAAASNVVSNNLCGVLFISLILNLIGGDFVPVVTDFLISRIVSQDQLTIFSGWGPKIG